MQGEFKIAGGMYQFISCFTNLESLLIYGGYYDELPLNVDLPFLLKSSPKLKKLSVLLKCGLYTLFSVDQIAQMDDNTAMENIGLRYDCIDHNTIEFIMQKLKNVKRLDLLPDDKEDSQKLVITESDPKDIFQRLSLYCESIERANVYVECAGTGSSVAMGNT